MPSSLAILKFVGNTTLTTSVDRITCTFSCTSSLGCVVIEAEKTPLCGEAVMNNVDSGGPCAGDGDHREILEEIGDACVGPTNVAFTALKTHTRIYYYKKRQESPCSTFETRRFDLVSETLMRFNTATETTTLCHRIKQNDRPRKHSICPQRKGNQYDPPDEDVSSGMNVFESIKQTVQHIVNL